MQIVNWKTNQHLELKPIYFNKSGRYSTNKLYWGKSNQITRNVQLHNYLTVNRIE